MSKIINITGGVDVGNGYVKAALRGADTSSRPDKFDIPSGVALVTGAVDLPTPDSAAGEVLSGDFYNELDVTFTSPLVHSTHRHLFGRRALKAQTPRFEEFDVVSGISKAEQSLSAVLVLGVFAGKAVRDYFEGHNALPTSQLEVEARVAVALPIDEYREHRHSFAAGFKQSSHLVTVLNFETPITVKITFADVQVAAEGASAQFAIRQHGLPLVESMLADVRAQGYALDGISAQDIYEARNTVAADVGEGTVNMPLYTDAKFNVDASRTFDKGYGTVLSNSLVPLKRAKLGFSSRKALADYLLAEPSPMKRAEHDKVKAIVAEQAQLFSEQVAEEFRKIMAEVGRDTEVVYVYGGGSGPVKQFLHPLLLELAPEGVPVLYLDARYSRHLNREGLLIAATMVEEQARAQEQAPASKQGRRAAAVAAA